MPVKGLPHYQLLIINYQLLMHTPIPYGRQNITQADIEAVTAVLQSDYLTQGPAVNAFENDFAQYIGCRYAVAVANGTAALHLAAMALGVNKQSKVLTTPITFAASANCILYCGGQVDFIDIDRETYLIDLNKTEDSLKKGGYCGIVPVDFAGYPVHLDELRYLADRYGCWVLEDACHAPGGYFTDSQGNKQHCGNSQFAELAIFSFHPVKHIASGEGGMICTNRRDLYEKLCMLRTHGITKNPEKMARNDGGWYYEMQELGYNYRLPDILAALGSSQLKRADEGLNRRQAIAQTYLRAFENAPIKTQQIPADMCHAYHLFVVEVDDRKGLYDFLYKKNIYSQVHYIPVHTLPYYQSLGFATGICPQAEDYYAHCLSLPMYPSLTAEQQAYVIEQVLAFVTEK